MIYFWIWHKSPLHLEVCKLRKMENETYQAQKTSTKKRMFHEDIWERTPRKQWRGGKLCSFWESWEDEKMRSFCSISLDISMRSHLERRVSWFYHLLGVGGVLLQ